MPAEWTRLNVWKRFIPVFLCNPLDFITRESSLWPLIYCPSQLSDGSKNSTPPIKHFAIVQTLLKKATTLWYEPFRFVNLHCFHFVASLTLP